MDAPGSPPPVPEVCPRGRCRRKLLHFREGGRDGYICGAGHILGEKGGRAKNGEGSALEQKFLELWRAHAPDMPPPEREYQPFLPARKFALDFCWRAAKVCVECDGFDHRQRERFRSDVDKLNLLQSAGWRQFRCTFGLLVDDGEAFVARVRAALTAALAEALTAAMTETMTGQAAQEEESPSPTPPEPRGTKRPPASRATSASG